MVVKADALALQECSPEQAETLAAHLGLAWHYVGTPLGRGGIDMGNAVLSDAPVLDRAHLWLPMTTAEEMRRVAVAAQLNTSKSSVWVVSVHLTRSPDAGEVALDLVKPETAETAARQAQISALVDFASELGGPVVLAGDLAFLPDSPEYRALAETGLEDAWRTRPRLGSRVTTPADCPYLASEMERYRDAARQVSVDMHDPGFCLDYQFIDPRRLRAGLAWTFGRPHSDEDEVWPSDHLGVCVDYTVRSCSAPRTPSR